MPAFCAFYRSFVASALVLGFGLSAAGARAQTPAPTAAELLEPAGTVISPRRLADPQDARLEESLLGVGAESIRPDAVRPDAVRPDVARPSAGPNVSPAAGLGDRFLPPPNLSELNEITQTAVVSPAQRRANRKLVISLEQRRVYVYENDEMMVSYPVAIGKDGWETPKGTWKVDQMIQNPSWQHPWTGEIVPPGPDNPLGRRWIGFWTDGVNSIGFHGTPNENLVGQAVSHGCVRMKNAHIEAMFRQIAMGAVVEVR